MPANENAAGGEPGAGLSMQRRWLDAVWPFVAGVVPPPAAHVVEIGCGPLGGFVPYLLEAGYRAEGIDPLAPTETGYHRIPFDDYHAPAPVDAVLACTALHHLPDVDAALDQVAEMLTSSGILVVVEWAWERLDEATARWCFNRLPQPAAGEPGWLAAQRDAWVASDQSWERHFAAWAHQDGLHPWQDLERALSTRFDTLLSTVGAHAFGDLPDTTEQAEQAAIDAGQICATGIRYVGRRSA